MRKKGGGDAHTKKEAKKEAERFLTNALQHLEENRVEDAVFSLNQSLSVLPNFADALYNIAVASFSKAEMLRSTNRGTTNSSTPLHHSDVDP